MNKLALNILLLFSLILVSCDGPTPSGDSRLLDFSLKTKDGATYVGTITHGEVVRLQIPLSVDLTDATPSYRLSQNAKIIPLPEQTKDWTVDQVFAVKSSGTAKRSYIVHVERTSAESVPQGSIYLYTDEDLAQFIKSGATDIAGNLVIGAPTGTDSIGDLSALTRLQHVAYDIIVNPTYKGKDLQGLRNIESAGAIHIKACPHLEKVRLNSLKTVYRDLVIEAPKVNLVSIPGLVCLSGKLDLSKTAVSSLAFPKLESLGSLTHTSSENLGVISMANLGLITGDLSLSNLKNLHRVDLPKLREISGKLTVNSTASLTSLSLPHLERLRALEVKNVSLKDLALPQVRTMETLNIINGPELAHLNLSQLTEVQKDLELTSLGVRSLEQVATKKLGGKLTLKQLTSLESIKAFLARLEGVKAIELNQFQGQEALDFSRAQSLEKFVFSTCPKITSLTFPAELQEVKISSDVNLDQPTLPKILGLKKVKGTLELTGLCPKDKTPTYGIESLEEVGFLRLETANITCLSFPHLRRITDEGLDFNYINSLYANGSKRADLLPPATLDFPELVETTSLGFSSHIIETLRMPKLKKVGEIKFACYYPVNKNSQLKDLSSLSALEEVNSVSITNLTALADYSFLKRAVQNGSLTSFDTDNNLYNPTLSDLKAGHFSPNN